MVEPVPINISQRLYDVEEKVERIALKETGGDGTSDGMDAEPKGSLGPRVTRLEYGLCACFLLLAGMICGLYLYVNGKFDTMSDRIASVQVQVAQTNGKIDLLLERTAPKN